MYLLRNHALLANYPIFYTLSAYTLSFTLPRLHSIEYTLSPTPYRLHLLVHTYSHLSHSVHNTLFITPTRLHLIGHTLSPTPTRPPTPPPHSLSITCTRLGAFSAHHTPGRSPGLHPVPNDPPVVGRLCEAAENASKPSPATDGTNHAHAFRHTLFRQGVNDKVY